MAGQDIRKLIPAAGGMPVNVSGDYIYLKFADRPIDVIINQGSSGQTRVTMEAGDKYRPGRFNQFEINNPDPENPAQVIFTVGEGDYNRQIVQGEISVIPGIRKSDGQFITDTRWTLAADVSITDTDTVNFVQFQERKQYATGITSTECVTYLPNSNEAFFDDNNGRHRRIDLNTLEMTAIDDGNGANTGVIEVYGKGYEYHRFNGQPDKDGNVWIGGGAVGSTKASLVKIDRLFNPLEVYEAPTDWIKDDARLNHAAICGDRIFHLNSDSANSFVIYEIVDGQHVQRGRYVQGEDYPSGIIRNCYGMLDHIVIGQNAGGAQAVIDITDFSVVPNDIGFGNCVTGVSVFEPKRVYLTGSYNSRLYMKNVITWTKEAEGYFETCAGGFVFNPVKQETSAGVRAIDNGDQVTISGQVIKMLLELYAGKFVTGDYLDYVYGVEFENANGRSPYTVQTGGESFATAKVNDNFTCVFPQRVKITLRNGIF